MECRVCGYSHNRVYWAYACLPCTNKIVKKITGKAMALVHKAIKSGQLPPLDGKVKCIDCGKPAKVYDHRDYFKPLDVDPVCYSCNHKRGPAKNRENLQEADEVLWKKKWI